MSDETSRFELSRRRVLAGLGGVGLASAAAGLGTSAYLSDTESFENNTITAGELDLKVDWEEHYSYPQIYGFDDPTSGLDYGLHRSDPGEPDEGEYVGFPDPENPMVWIHSDDIPTYMDATSIESFPDPNGDGVQEMEYVDEEEEIDFAYMPCDHGADVPEDMDPSGGGLASRTQNPDTWDGEERKSLIALEDIKPGDFGEFTLSFHLCDNPGYVWLQAANDSESGGANPDPEQAAEGDDENDANLAENIQTAWWYDTDGNNVIDETVGKVDVMIAVDTSGSLNEEQVGLLESAANDLATELDSEADARIGGLSFADTVTNFTGLDDSPVSFSGLTAGGGTMMPAALDIAADELDAEGRADAETFIVLFTDGGPNYNPNDDHTAGGYTVGPYTNGNTDWDTVTDSELNETSGVADTIRNDHRILAVGIDDDHKPEGRSGDPNAPLLSMYLRDEIAGSAGDYFSAESPGTVSDVENAIIDAIAVPEQVFHRGTLADDLDVLTDGNGIPLDGALSTDFDELNDPPEDEDRDCFEDGVNYFIGFAWWLPTDVGNEVQGDSVSFDFGFYTEQCRNNDGSGTTA